MGSGRGRPRSSANHLTPLIFLHLPKTAGTTLSAVLSRHVPADQCHYLRSADGAAAVETFKATPAEQRRRIRLLQGHQVFGLHEYLAPGARYLTIVRDPVDRIATHFDYVVRTEHPMFIDPIRDEGMSLYDYAISGISGELENGQVRWIAGIDGDRPLGPADLDRALLNIDNYFAWVGVQERFSESLVALAMTMRWLRVGYRSTNVRPPSRSAEVPPIAREAILAHNPLDARLHQAMIERLDDGSMLGRLTRRSLASVLDRLGRTG